MTVAAMFPPRRVACLAADWQEVNRGMPETLFYEGCQDDRTTLWLQVINEDGADVLCVDSEDVVGRDRFGEHG